MTSFGRLRHLWLVNMFVTMLCVMIIAIKLWVSDDVRKYDDTVMKVFKELLISNLLIL
jgi:hypothetical protein